MIGTLKNVIDYSLKEMKMYSEDAASLVFRTGMAESGYRHLRQVSGPALGFFQSNVYAHLPLVMLFGVYNAIVVL